MIDPEALVDRITSTANTMRRENFRRGIVARDGHCLVTGELAEICQATHLIPFRKGDEVPLSQYLHLSISLGLFILAVYPLRVQ